MNQIENLCKKLGFKQADLATYLGVSAQLLGMIASGKRKLPLGMLSRLEELEQICRIAEQKQPDAERTQLFDLHQIETEKALQDHASLCRKKARDVRKKLSKLEETTAQIETASQLKKNEHSTEEMETPELLLEICRRRATESLATNQTMAMAFLKLEIARYEFEEKKSLEMVALKTF